MRTVKERHKADMDRMLDETMLKYGLQELEMSTGVFRINRETHTVERVAGPIEMMARDIQQARAIRDRVEVENTPRILVNREVWEAEWAEPLEAPAVWTGSNNCSSRDASFDPHIDITDGWWHLSDNISIVQESPRAELSSQQTVENTVEAMYDGIEEVDDD